MTKPQKQLNKVLVIGGAGYIGSHTVIELLSAGYTPVVLDNFSNSKPSVINRIKKLSGKKVKFYSKNYQDVRALEHIIKKEGIEAVIHFAAFKAVGESVEKPLLYYSNNVGGFINLLIVLKKCQVKQLVFSSSAAVYGSPKVQAVTEQTICNPTSPYGWSKYMDEQILKDECKSRLDLNATCLRYFNVVGADPSALIGGLPIGRPQNLLPIITQATAGKIPPLTVYGDDYDTPDGSCLRDYVHVVDLAKAHVYALKNNKGYKVYNIGTGKPTSVLELIKIFEEENNVKIPYSIGDRRPGDPASYYANADKANRELGWRATKDIRDAVKDAWRWQQTLSNL